MSIVVQSQLKKSVPASPCHLKASYRLKVMVLSQISTLDLGLVYSIMNALEQSTESACYGDANEFAVD